MLNALSTSAHRSRLLPEQENLQLKIKMPPKRKILGDLPTNITSSAVNSGNQEGVRPLKRQQRQPREETAKSLSAESKEAAPHQIASESTTIFQEKKPPRRQRAHAESLPPLPQFQQFDSPYPEHCSKVGT